MGFLNPYGLLTGVLFVLLFLVHGALYVTVKTEGEVQKNATALAGKVWNLLVAAEVAFLVATALSTRLYDNFLRWPLLLAVPVLAAAALLGTGLFLGTGVPLKAFASSCLMIVLVVATGVIGLFPNLIPSRRDAASSLTIYNSSSSPYTLRIMTIVAAIFVPIVILYKIWAYCLFRAKITTSVLAQEEETY